MPWWAWIGCIAIVLACGHQLWRALTLGKIKYGAAAIDYDRTESPVSFWFFVGLAIAGVILFGGALAIIAAGELGLLHQ